MNGSCPPSFEVLGWALVGLLVLVLLLWLAGLID
jgi:hypothetical protein